MDCMISQDYDEMSYTLQHKVVTSRKEHECEECGCTIDNGSEYELYRGVQDDTFFTVKTCLDCVSIRKSFFKHGICVFGTMLDDVREQIMYGLGGEVASKCIIPLTDKGKERVFEYIEESWEK